MKKKMLITGTNKGLGLSCKKEFEKDYDVISCSRKDGTEIGDLRDLNFLKNIVEKHPEIDVLINNAGVMIDEHFENFALVNYFACGFLLEAYSKRMNSGNIITIGSNAANYTGVSVSPQHRVWYTSTKHAIRTLSLSVSANFDNVKTTILEPTSIRHYSNLNYPYITKVIRWIIDQPVEIPFISLKGSVKPDE
jgi:NAD(P)-dependent dehydrogenase (short-subunit alcohol dehydrogenase family)